MNKNIGILQLSYGNYVSLDDYVKLQTRWDSLREWLEENGFYERQDFIDSIINPNEDKLIYIDDILDKMNELEGEDNDT